MSHIEPPSEYKRNKMVKRFIVGGWSIGLALIVYFWATSAAVSYGIGVSGVIGSISRLFGLVATYSALTQILLMGRVWWIERPFGLDTLARFHRLNGFAVLIGISVHASLMITSHSLQSGRGYFSQYIATVTTYPNVFQAAIAQLLFLLVVVSTVYIVRRRLRFESWYYVHLFAYMAVALASLHQFTTGSTLLSNPSAMLFWYGMYGFVVLNLLVWRLGMPVVRLIRSGYYVERIEEESPSVASIYISPRRGNGISVIPGQFVLVRFLTATFGREEHPFTVSHVVAKGRLRLSIRSSGDFTAAIPSVPIGTSVVVSGPFGRFTAEKALTDKRLFIAGGIGITPIRAMLEEAVHDGVDSVVLYANRTPDDVPLKDELEVICQKGRCKMVYVFSDESAGPSQTIEAGHITAERIKKHVPDFLSRDVYLCGPPPMMDAVCFELAKFGFPKEQLHIEKFALHP